jgi:hypothetical protein
VFAARVYHGGRVLRYATEAIEIADGAGLGADAAGAYEPGLSAIEAPAGAPSVGIAIVDGSIDWTAVARQLLGATAAVDAIGVDGGSSRAVVRGRVSRVSWTDDGVSLTVDATERTGTAKAPDVLASVSVETWPFMAFGEPFYGFQLGRPYPIVLGTPGNEGATGAVSEAYPVVPAPSVVTIVPIATTVHYAVVAEDAPESTATSARVYNAATEAAADATIEVVTDALGRSIRVAVLDGILTPSEGDAADYYVGFGDGGGGVGVSLYDAVRYVLRRFAALGDVDWTRVAAAEDALSPYRVDTWIDAWGTDPWALVRSWTADLPVEIRDGPRGRYFVHVSMRRDDRRLVGAISVDDGDAYEDGPPELDGSDRASEFSCSFRADRLGNWRRTIVLCGRDGLAVPRITQPDTRLVRSDLCTRSAALFGPRAAEPLTIDWTWDEPTVVRVLEEYALRRAIPAVRASYVLRGPAARDLDEGDQIDVTDTARGFAGARAVVVEPPVLSVDAVTVQLAILHGAG